MFCADILLSIPDEKSNHVRLCLKVYGLQPKSSLVRFLHKLGSVETPEKLLKNVKVLLWQLTATSFHVEMNVKTDRKRPKRGHSRSHGGAVKKAKSSAVAELRTDELPEGWERFRLRIRQFPSEIDCQESTMTVGICKLINSIQKLLRSNSRLVVTTDSFFSNCAKRTTAVTG
jgi:hypothetical protein